MSERTVTAEAAAQTTAQTTDTAGPADHAAASPVTEPETQVTTADVLVEEVSIDGMFGVY